ncbi:STM4014 family protein [Clostridium senegalense]
MEFLLIGEKLSKRTEFFLKAAIELGYTIKFLPWENWKKEDLHKVSFIKVDPPIHKEYKINKLPKLINDYKNQLMLLENIKGVTFLNSPLQIYNTLDKFKCKNILMKNGIATTPIIESNIKSLDDLREFVQNKKVYEIFIKPRYGSGAAGVLAYRYNPKMNKEIVYTSLEIDCKNEICNTKKMRKITDENKISMILNLLLKEEIIVEKWIPKSIHNGLSYDLRVVYQYGKIDFIVGRGSKTPITNLHLNNCGIDIEDIKLSKEIKVKIENLCFRAMQCFKGLNSAGIDILITPKGNPMIIEINGQGDLIYKDIFNENKIYKSQMRGMICKDESVK